MDFISPLVQIFITLVFSIYYGNFGYNCDWFCTLPPSYYVNFFFKKNSLFYAVFGYNNVKFQVSLPMNIKWVTDVIQYKCISEI